MPREVISIEGLSPEEILTIPDKQIDALVLTGEPIVFKAGSAEILGEFRIKGTRLTVELAQIDGGGEGVLPTLWVLADRYAHKRSLSEVEWIVHAVHCAQPNLKLRRVLERRGFEVIMVRDSVQAYYKLIVL